MLQELTEKVLPYAKQLLDLWILQYVDQISLHMFTKSS